MSSSRCSWARYWRSHTGAGGFAVEVVMWAAVVSAVLRLVAWIVERFG